MAYVKLASFAVFLLAAFVILPMKKVEADQCDTECGGFNLECNSGCYCEITDCPYGICVGVCRPQSKVEEHPKLCWSHDECTKKGSGNYCARFPNSDIKYGFCFASVSEAQDAFKMAITSKFKKDFLKMPGTTA